MAMSSVLSKIMGERPTPSNKKPDYISGEKSNPHASPKNGNESFYDDHGRGKVFTEKKEKHEDKVQHGKSKGIW